MKENSGNIANKICSMAAVSGVFLSLLFCNVTDAAGFVAKTIASSADVTVMEVEGNYDADLAGGDVNSIPRNEIAKEFYKNHPDDYDFLVIFSNFDFQMPAGEANAFYLGIKNDVQGIGQDLYDNSSLFGSDGSLQGMIDMGNISALASDPLAPAFSGTMNLLSHEFSHRWVAHVKFQDNDGNTSSDLLGKDGNHWSFLLDTKGSLHYGNRWLDNC